MQDDEDFERRATAAVLETGVMIGRASLLLALFALVLVFPIPRGERVLIFASAAFGLLQGWLALRVAVDARLFALIGLPGHLAALDRVLGRLRTSAPPERGFAERSRGALRLWKLQVVTFFLQALCLLGAVIALV
ncbi:MAG: hypothetical protein ACJ76N_14405 [Thermoanaerobaculia bacterium]